MNAEIVTVTAPKLRLAPLTTRLIVIAVVLFVEKFLLNFLVDFDAAQRAGGFGALVRWTQHWAFRFTLSFAVCLALLAWLSPRRAGVDPASDEPAPPIRPRLLLWHALLFLPLAPLSYVLYGDRGTGLPFPVRVAAWVGFAAAAVLVLFAAFAPWPVWRRAARGLGPLWIFAGAAAAAAVGLMQVSQMLWAPTARLTFELVVRLLAPLLPMLQADPATRILRTPDFAVEVSDVCSGLEGVGLMLGFCCAWILCFRREFRFPRVLLLAPIGVALVFGLNVLRIAVLMLIGAGGHPDVAIYGFHSVAGWIAFNCAAAAIAVTSRRSAWLARDPRPAPLAVAGERDGNPTADYLVPLLAVLSGGMLSRAISGTFETFYGVKLLAGALALAYLRPRLRDLDWRGSWRGVLAGAGIAALWILAAQMLVRPAAMPVALAALPAGERLLWIALRAAGGIVLVPIVEELAYRGYLMRRLQCARFESLPFAAVRFPALALSALAFGAVHGSFWLPGVAAGLAYGALARHTGRLGEAVFAHATSNLLIAVMVLGAGAWQLW